MPFLLGAKGTYVEDIVETTFDNADEQSDTASWQLIFDSGATLSEIDTALAAVTPNPVGDAPVQMALHTQYKQQLYYTTLQYTILYYNWPYLGQLRCEVSETPCACLAQVCSSRAEIVRA